MTCKYAAPTLPSWLRDPCLPFRSEGDSSLSVVSQGLTLPRSLLGFQAGGQWAPFGTIPPRNKDKYTEGRCAGLAHGGVCVVCGLRSICRQPESENEAVLGRALGTS